jgi:uncharacterized damage-inducible protein DinB
MPIERIHASPTAPEPETLNAFLDYHRATLLNKVEGVSDEDLRRPLVPSGTTLLGLVKHLAHVERWWFSDVFAGREVHYPWSDADPDADLRVEPEESTDLVLDLFRTEIEASRAIVAGASSLDDLSARALPRGGEVVRYSLRWILVHMIEETARHNGHADILREQIDGATGE